jgi:hypothetical protein
MRSVLKILLAGAAAVLAGRTIAAAQPAAGATHVVVPAAAPEAADVGSIDGMIRAYYAVITGPPGQPRQWSRDRTLYIPDMRFVAAEVDAKGRPEPRIMSHQQFVDSSDASLVAKGFDEREIHRVTQRFGNIAHVFSTYETREKSDGPVLARGINSIELFWDGTRWWIASAIWDEERPDNPIPKAYLP